MTPAAAPTQVFIGTPEHRRVWALRDLLAVNQTPTCITVVDRDTGAALSQNAASRATFGELEP